MTLWILLAVMAAIAAAGVCLPLARARPSRKVLAACLAMMFVLALAGLYPWLGRPDLAFVRPPTTQDAIAKPDSEFLKLASLLEARLRATPGDAKGWRLLGVCYSQTGRYNEAANAFGRAAALAPGDAEALSSEGEALVQAANGLVTPGARSVFSRTLTLSPDDPRARYFLAMAKDEDGDHDGAMADWVAMIKNAPPDAPWLADIREFVERVAAARGVDLTAQLGAQAPPAADQPMIRAMVDRLAARLKASPRDVDGWIQLMRSRMVLGDTAAATSALQDGLAAFADSPTEQAKLRAAAGGLGGPGPAN